MTVTVKKKHIQAFTLVETVTALIVSGAIFVGVFSIFSILNNKFEAELVRGELVTYCNYALDDMAQSIRLADQVDIDNDEIITRINSKIVHTYALSQEKGIKQDVNPAGFLFCSIIFLIIGHFYSQQTVNLFLFPDSGQNQKLIY